MQINRLKKKQNPADGQMRPCSGPGCWMTAVIMSRHSRCCQENILLLFLIRPISWNIITGSARIYDALGRKTKPWKPIRTLCGWEKTGVNIMVPGPLYKWAIFMKAGETKKMHCIYFKKVLDMKSHDYKNALDQKAKAGVERCTGRLDFLLYFR